jgi:glutathione synthase/RimK-type ligase-like ATP-grasp enzyme
MKKALILSNKKDWRDTRPFKNIKFYQCYEYFSDLARTKNLSVFSASYAWYDEKKKIFKFAWTFDGKRWRKTRNVQPDIIYDKTSFSDEIQSVKNTIRHDYQIINDPEFTLLVGHKLFASLLAPKYFKKYYPVRSPKSIREALQKIPGKKIVLKPPLECGGRGVKILPKKELVSSKLSSPMIAQEFIDSSNGIRGILRGIHDLRAVFVNKKLVYVFVREPAKNSLLANLAQGGTMFYVPENKLPKTLLPIISEIQDAFLFFEPKIYSIDFMFDQAQKPWIIEFNTMPGFFFFSETHKKKQKRLFLEIINTLLKEAV